MAGHRGGAAPRDGQLILEERLYDREFVRRWVNWEEYLREEHPDEPQTFETFEAILPTLYAQFTPEFAEKEWGVAAATIVEVAREIGAGGLARSRRTSGATRRRATSAAGRSRGLSSSCACSSARSARPAGPRPPSTTSSIPAPPLMPPPQKVWSELLFPREYPLAFYEMSFLLPHFLKEGRGKVDAYFTRVYNPVWTNPDGLMWIEMLSDEAKIGLHAASPRSGTRPRSSPTTCCRWATAPSVTT